VQVSAYDTGSVICRSMGWGNEQGDLEADIRCHAPTGGFVDERFTVAWFRGMGLKGPGADRVAYLLANRPKVASYAPDTAHRYSSAGQAPRVNRTGVGRYVVRLRGMPLGGSAQVTAFGASQRRCVVSAIETGQPVATGGCPLLRAGRRPGGREVHARLRPLSERGGVPDADRWMGHLRGWAPRRPTLGLIHQSRFHQSRSHARSIERSEPDPGARAGANRRIDRSGRGSACDAARAPESRACRIMARCAPGS
jgi:hypothetical protein